jgi:hypothetical protein
VLQAASHLFTQRGFDATTTAAIAAAAGVSKQTLYRTTVVETGAAQLRKLLDEAQDRGLVRPDIDTGLAVRLIAGPLLTWLFGDGLLAGGQSVRPPKRVTMRDLIEILLDGLTTRQTRRASVARGRASRALAAGSRS